MIEDKNTIENNKIIVEIFKSKSNSFSKYFIELNESTRVLDLLNIIKKDYDNSLNFMQNCSHGICGSCALKVNGKPTLACKTKIKDIIDKDNKIILEPLNPNYIKKDLEMNFSPFLESFKQIPDYLINSNTKTPDKKSYSKIGESDNCIRCGICFYSCPVIENKIKFIAPATAAKNYRFIADFRDSNTKNRIKISDELSWACIKCFKCTEYCPREVDPFSSIEKTHSMILNSKSIGKKHASSMTKQITKNGIFNEFKLAVDSIGFIKALKFAPYGALRFFTNNFRILKKPKNYREIRKILEQSDE